MNGMLQLFDDLETRTNADITKLSDTELQQLYNDLEYGKDYYHSMEQVVKLLSNAIYGALGSVYFRFYNHRVAEDITVEGKMFMFIVDHTVNDYFKQWATDTEFHDAIRKEFPSYTFEFSNINKQEDIANYGDTDSRYFAFGRIFEVCGFKPKSIEDACNLILFIYNKKLDILINDAISKDIIARNGDLGYMVMELESIGGKGIFLAKKKYIMSMLWEDGKFIYDKGKIKATGVEINQSSTSQFVKNSIKAVLRKLLTPGTKMQEIYTIGSRLVNIAKSAPIDEITLAQGISNYDKWVIDDKINPQWIKGTNAHVKAAIIYNAHLEKYNLTEQFPKYRIGKIRWYYALNEWGVFGVPDGVKVEDLPHHAPIDYNLQVDKLIITPLKRYIFNSNIDKSSFGSEEVLMSFKNL